ncbi:hypothetical protein CLOM_g8410 [Closterium sp. NIES-68]|nr:hypothetical protein CLOM_g8410 [Closterium sp. NIES-68]
MASQFLSNVAALLQPGGIFFGLLPDSSTLWYKQQRAIDAAKAAVGSGGAGATRPVIRSSLYSIVFENPTPFEDSKAVFDLRFAFKSADPSSLPAKSLLVHFPTLIRLAEAAGLRLIDIINLETLYNDTRSPQTLRLLADICPSALHLHPDPRCDAAAPPAAAAGAGAPCCVAGDVSQLHLSNSARDLMSLFAVFIFSKPLPASLLPPPPSCAGVAGKAAPSVAEAPLHAAVPTSQGGEQVSVDAGGARGVGQRGPAPPQPSPVPQQQQKQQQQQQQPISSLAGRSPFTSAPPAPTSNRAAVAPSQVHGGLPGAPSPTPQAAGMAAGRTAEGHGEREGQMAKEERGEWGGESRGGEGSGAGGEDMGGRGERQEQAGERAKYRDKTDGGIGRKAVSEEGRVHGSAVKPEAGGAASGAAGVAAGAQGVQGVQERSAWDMEAGSDDDLEPWALAGPRPSLPPGPTPAHSAPSVCPPAAQLLPTGGSLSGSGGGEEPGAATHRERDDEREQGMVRDEGGRGADGYARRPGHGLGQQQLQQHPHRNAESHRERHRHEQSGWDEEGGGKDGRDEVKIHPCHDDPRHNQQLHPSHHAHPSAPSHHPHHRHHHHHHHHHHNHHPHVSPHAAAHSCDPHMPSQSDLAEGVPDGALERRGSVGGVAVEGGEGEEGAVRWTAQGKRERSRRKPRGLAMEDILRRTAIIAARGLEVRERSGGEDDSGGWEGKRRGEVDEWEEWHRQQMAAGVYAGQSRAGVHGSAGPARHDAASPVVGALQVVEADAGGRGEHVMGKAGDARRTGAVAAGVHSETALGALGVLAHAGQGGGLPIVQCGALVGQARPIGIVDREPIITYSLKRSRKSLNKEHLGK